MGKCALRTTYIRGKSEYFYKCQLFATGVLSKSYALFRTKKTK